MEMQIKTTRYHLILTRAVMIKMVVSVGKVMKTPIHCWWGCKVVQPVLGKSLAIIQRAKHKVIILSSNSTNLDIPKRRKTCATQKPVHKCSQYCCVPLQPHRLQPTRLLCPCNFPSKNAGGCCHFLLQGNLPEPKIEPMSLVSPALVGRFFTTGPPGKPMFIEHYSC